jgi:hypothetical protein
MLNPYVLFSLVLVLSPSLSITRNRKIAQYKKQPRWGLLFIYEA